VRPSTLYELNPYSEKPFMFDALLGRKKLHREMAFQFINEHQLNGITTYVNDHKNNFHNGNWIWESDGLEEYENVEWTVERVKYYGYKMCLSQIIPLDVYNKTAYSLVAETNFDNDYVFFTEKIVKPIIGRRLFILLGNRFALEKLREIGFKTFDGIIDESYDEIEDISERHKAALAQLKWLCEQPQSVILEKCREIVDHNFNLMMGRDWHNDIRPPIQRLMFSQ
jgi:hypothetical protein